jgi:hypothetical protein
MRKLEIVKRFGNLFHIENWIITSSYNRQMGKAIVVEVNVRIGFYASNHFSMLTVMEIA